MSSTEFHTGKLYPVKLQGSLEETCRIIASNRNLDLGEDWEERFIDSFDKYANRRRPDKEEYFIHRGRLYKVVDHSEVQDDEQCFMRLSRNPDSSISFIGQFYNGGTCFSEMLEEALDEFPEVDIETNDIARYNDAEVMEIVRKIMVLANETDGIGRLEAFIEKSFEPLRKK
jgi:hypothetical protein